MATNNLASYKYNTNAKSALLFKGMLSYFLVIVLVGACIILGFILPIFFGLIILGIIYVYSMSKKNQKIIIDKNFFILGDKVTWYANIEEIRILPQHRKMVIIRNNKLKKITIEATGFPTDARKPHKIKANQTKKFKNFCSKMLEKTRTNYPHIKVTR